MVQAQHAGRGTVAKKHSAVNAAQRIRVTRNGPYIVSGHIPLARQIIVSDEAGDPIAWRQGEQYAVGDRYALCRCGQSRKRPFCDGTHGEVHFDGTETASRDPYLEQANEADGPTLRLTDARVLCANAGFCTRCGGTWELAEHSDLPEARAMAVEQACHCPSGRLVAWDKDGQAIEPDLEPSIGLIENPCTGAHGPIWVRGGIPIEAADGHVYEVRNRVTLCGCGRSCNKPFCDGTHTEL
jgi:CDGSH-type Zn-finger protein